MVSTVTALLALSLSTVPIPSGMISNTPIAIDTSPDDQYDPHVDGDLTAYSHAPMNGNGPSEIRYYRFGSSAPFSVMPGSLGVDILSDVNQGRIVFTRVFPTSSVRSMVMLFDTNLASPTPVEINPSPTSNRIGVALGTNTVFYSDLSLAPINEYGYYTGEMVVYDLASATEHRLTNDLINDMNPAVAPSGDTVVWEKCTNGLFDCEVWQAVRTGGTWTSSFVGPMPSLGPDTNGTLVVYQGNRTGGIGGTDIYMRPVAGGPEVPLEIDGEQANPSVRGGLIAFESGASAYAADIYLYEIATNRLFQITNSPAHESLNDVTILPSGQVRIVWNVDQPDFTRDVYGSTFSIPPPPPTCQPQTVTLQASRQYSPSRSTDADMSFASPFTFALPAEIPVTAGNAGNHWVELKLYTASGCETKCKYRGGSNYAHPQSPSERAKGARYVFAFCTGQGMGLEAGDAVQVNRVKLHVVNGDNWQGTTRVEVSLAGQCGPPPPPICGGNDDDDDDDDGEDDDDDDDGHHGGHGGHGHGGHCGDGDGKRGHQGGHVFGGHHRRERNKPSRDPTGTVSQAIDAEPTPSTGCSATSSGLGWPALLAAAALFLLRRRSMPIGLAEAPERRRLPR
ncbi:MAG: hypothetical protein AB1938_15935 [Myxococcota bacterium]